MFKLLLIIVCILSPSAFAQEDATLVTCSFAEDSTFVMTRESNKLYLTYSHLEFANKTEMTAVSGYEFLGFENLWMISFEFIQSRHQFLFSIWDMDAAESIVSPIYLDCQVH